LAVVAVERALVAVLRGQLAKVAQVLADPLRRDGGVLPTLVGVGPAGEERRRPEPGLAHLPDMLLGRRVVVELHSLERTALLLLQRSHQLVRLLIGLVLRLAAELDEQP